LAEIPSRDKRLRLPEGPGRRVSPRPASRKLILTEQRCCFLFFLFSSRAGDRSLNTLYQFLSTTLADRKIDAEEVELIREHVHRDDNVDLSDVQLLVELYCGADQHCRAFEDLLFDVLDRVLLADGEVHPAELYYLMKLLYSDRIVRPREKEFLLHLQRRLKHPTPEFNALCEEIRHAHPTEWDVGGHAAQKP
jgi:hypothetical protein